VVARTLIRPIHELIETVALMPASVDFQDVSQAEELLHVFQFQNRGRESIQIVGFYSTCGCIPPDDLIGVVVAPAENLSLPVRLRTGDKDGQLSGVVTVFYQRAEAGLTAYKSLELRATVVSDYSVHPLLVDFGRVVGPDSVTRKVTIRPNRLRNLKLLDLSIDHPAFVASQVVSERRSSDVEVTLAFSADQLWQSGPISSVLCLHTNSSRVPIARVLVLAHFEAPIEVSPSAIVIGADIGGLVQREILITARRPVQILSLHCPEPEIRIDSWGRALAHDHRIRLTIPERSDGRQIDSKVDVELRTSSGPNLFESPVVTIPIHRLPREERTNLR
jgi:hypothetical protein